MFQLRCFCQQCGDAAFDFEAERLGCRRGVDDDAADQRANQRDRFAVAVLTTAQCLVILGNLLPVAICGLGENSTTLEAGCWLGSAASRFRSATSSLDSALGH
jgi:hypothetical protein